MSLIVLTIGTTKLSLTQGCNKSRSPEESSHIPSVEQNVNEQWVMHASVLTCSNAAYPGSVLKTPSQIRANSANATLSCGPWPLLPVDRRVLALVQRAEPGEDRLDECVARGRVRVATVHVRDEENAGGGRRAREDAGLLEDDLGSGV